MLNRITSAMRKAAKQSARQVIAHSTTMRTTNNKVVATARHAVMALGLTAIATLALMFFKPEVAEKIQAISPFSDAVAATPSDDDLMPPMANLMDDPASATIEDAPLASTNPAMLGTDVQQQRVTQWISKRYRVANDATNMLVSAAYLTAKEINLDPLLILAVMAIESRFNPFAESPVGAQGLMQVMSKVHHERFQEMGGVQAALNPVANIRVGSLILKDYVTRGGSVEAGLKTYVGAANFATDSGYGSRVLAEYRRLKQVSAGQRVPTSNAVMASNTPAPAKASTAMPVAETGSLTIKVAPHNEIAGL